MSMSKKHYVAVAKAINDTLWDEKTDPATVTSLIIRLIWVFRDDNPLFDKRRFIEACMKDRDTVSQPGWDAYKAERARLGL